MMEGLLEAGGRVAPVLLDATLKGTALLLVILAGARLMRRAPAATRHQLWAAGLVSLIVLPLAAYAVPWKLEVLPDAAAVRVLAGVRSDAVVTFADDGTGTPATASVGSGAEEADPSASPAQASARGALVQRGAGLIWATGALLGVLLLIVSGASASRMVGRAEVLDEEPWRADARAAAGRIGLTRPVMLLRGRNTRLAFTTGLFRPAIVLPAECTGWTAERRLAVLLHELAHVQRHDLLIHLVGRLACALHWFNPLVWLAARRQRAEGEKACDDLVLASGATPSAYAGHLLDIVRGAGDLRAPYVVVPMAHRSEFEGRILAILAPAQARHSSRVGSAATIALAGTMVVLLAAMSPVSTAQPGSQERAVSVPARAQVGALKNPDPLVREDAARRLVGVEDTLAIAALGRALAGDRSAAVRERAAWALAHLSSAAGIPALSAALRTDPAVAVRNRAAWALGILGDPAGVVALVDALDDEDAGVRDRAGWGLGLIRSPGAVAGLRGALDDPAREVRLRAVWALGRIGGDEAVGVLTGALRHDDEDVRLAAARALGQGSR